MHSVLSILFVVVVASVVFWWSSYGTQPYTNEDTQHTDKTTPENSIIAPIEQAKIAKSQLEGTHINNNQNNTEKTLNLSGKDLTSVPSYVFDRTDITTLDLSNNVLSGALPAEIRKLQNLKVLDLHNNVFTGVPAEIGQLQKLETLDLSHNQITGLPYELGNLQSLKVLDLTGNNYSEADLDKIRQSLPSTVRILR